MTRVTPPTTMTDMGREAYKDQVSDHLPFVATFRIDKDRD